MKIATKTGDKGATSLLGGRVLKNDDRIVCVGDIDELSAAIGLLKINIINNSNIPINNSNTSINDIKMSLSAVQNCLILIMGEITNTDESKYKFEQINEDHLKLLDENVEKLENIPSLIPNDWILYGDNFISAAADFASKVCRRAERSIVDSHQKRNYRPIILQYINRLSDYLYLIARFYEKQLNKVKN